MSTEPASGRPAQRLHTVATYAYVGSVSALAVALCVLGWVWAGPPRDLPALTVLVVLGVTGWALRETNVGGHVQLSFLSIILLAAGVIVGPVGAAVVGMTAPLVNPGEHYRLVIRVFNLAMFSCIGSVGGLVYIAAGGARELATLDGAGAILLSVGLPLIVADVAQCLTNAVVLAGVLRIANGVPMRGQIGKLLSTSGIAYVGYGIIGFLFVVLWVPAGVGWFSAILVLAPLFVARWAFAQYGDEQRSHERTLDALVAAYEAKDPVSDGHLARVARLCEWMAESMGLPYKEVQDVRAAGMLHDLGKLAVPTRVLRMQRARTDEELALLAEHPLHSVDMLGDIEFVARSLPAIAHHHERFDGLGYPLGLAGEEIPLGARIIAAADTFDALTTTRPYRPALTPDDALAEVRRRAGTHLDPVVVAALERAVARHGWVSTERGADLLAMAGVAFDHDDPQTSDHLAERARQRRVDRAPTGPMASPMPSTEPSTEPNPAPTWQAT